MALIDVVQLGIPTERLKQLTNYNTSPTAINTTYLQQICDDVEGIFLSELGREYQFTGITASESKLHNALAINGVQILLENRKGLNSEVNERIYNAWISQLRNARDKTFSDVPPDAGDTKIRDNESEDETLALRVEDELGWSAQADRLPAINEGASRDRFVDRS